MSWWEAIVDELTPLFGGVVSFVLDPDDLLDTPEVREAFFRRGVRIDQWVGDPSELDRWKKVPETDRILVVAKPDQPIHRIAEELPDAVLLDTSISKVFRKMDTETVRNVPREQWDALYRLQTQERPLRTRDEAAVAVARGVYGIDPLYASLHGWNLAVERVASTGLALPKPIARVLVPDDPEAMAALCDVAIARNRCLSLCSPQLVRTAGSGAAPRVEFGPDEERVLEDLAAGSLPAEEVLSFALRYARLCAEGLDTDSRLRANEAFLPWMRRNYDLAMRSHNPRVLRLPELVESLVPRNSRVLFVVVDGMSLEAWTAVRLVWEQEHGLAASSEWAAFGVVPTITSFARRAIFEGCSPMRFSGESHSTSLERRLWRQRFPTGAYFAIAEREALTDALYQGKTVAVVDVSLDRRCHDSSPALETIPELARVWATKCGIAEVARAALELGYRVVLTSDHGQAAGRGIGLPNVGLAAEIRAKRCLLFTTEETLRPYAERGISDFVFSTAGANRRTLFARYGESFDYQGMESVSHGGLSLEEVIVPVVEFAHE